MENFIKDMIQREEKLHKIISGRRSIEERVKEQLILPIGYDRINTEKLITLEEAISRKFENILFYPELGNDMDRKAIIVLERIKKLEKYKSYFGNHGFLNKESAKLQIENWQNSQLGKELLELERITICLVLKHYGIKFPLDLEQLEHI